MARVLGQVRVVLWGVGGGGNDRAWKEKKSVLPKAPALGPSNNLQVSDRTYFAVYKIV